MTEANKFSPENSPKPDQYGILNFEDCPLGRSFEVSAPIPPALFSAPDVRRALETDHLQYHVDNRTPKGSCHSTSLEVKEDNAD